MFEKQASCCDVRDISNLYKIVNAFFIWMCGNKKMGLINFLTLKRFFGRKILI